MSDESKIGIEASESIANRMFDYLNERVYEWMRTEEGEQPRHDMRAVFIELFRLEIDRTLERYMTTKPEWWPENTPLEIERKICMEILKHAANVDEVARLTGLFIDYRNALASHKGEAENRAGVGLKEFIELAMQWGKDTHVRISLFQINELYKRFKAVVPIDGEAINILFDGPPGPEGGRFVEVEDGAGKSISVGTWMECDDGYWRLRIEYVLRAGKREGWLACSDCPEDNRCRTAHTGQPCDLVKPSARTAESTCMPKKGDWVAWKYMGDWHAAFYDPEWMKSWESHGITSWVILESAASGEEINEQVQD